MTESVISVDDLRNEINEQYHRLYQEAQGSGAATLYELANLAGNLSKVIQVVDDLATAIIRLRDAQP